MHESSEGCNRRILVIDDNRAIHDDFRKIFEPGVASAQPLAHSREALFGDATRSGPLLLFRVDFASQGTEGAALVERARSKNEPFAMAFVDMRMPPGWDGIETTRRIWELDPRVQIVICTAYSDHSWQDILGRLGHSDRLLILKKPFDNIEVLQLASALTEKWRLADVAARRVQDLETLVELRTEALQRSNARLAAVNQLLELQTERAKEMHYVRPMSSADP
jgi:two-component system, NtrC family, sensor kinase